MVYSSICLEINSPCTLDCFYCFRTISNHQLSVADLRKHGELLGKLVSRRFVISGGEPLLHPDVFEIVNFLKSTYPNRVVAVTTGMYVNGTTIDRLLANDSVIDEYLLNFETSDDALLNEIKRRPCADVLKTNLIRILDARPDKARVNVVLSRPEIFGTLRETLKFLRSNGVRRIKFFRDVRVEDAYKISLQEVQLLKSVVAEYRGDMKIEGADSDYLLGHSKVPDPDSSQALCFTNIGEIVEREERDALTVLQNYSDKLARFTKHLKGYTSLNYLFSKYVALGTVSIARLLALSLLGIAIIQIARKLHIASRDPAFVTYALPIYAIYVTIWTSSLWVRRSELLERMASILGQYGLLHSECSPLIRVKLDKQLVD